MAGRASELVPRGHGRGPHSAAVDAAAGVFIVQFYLGVRIYLEKKKTQPERTEYRLDKMVLCLFGLTIACIAYELNTRFVFPIR